MPELPEVETVRRGLQSKILNKKIIEVKVLLPKIVSVGPETVSNKRPNSKKVAQTFSRRIVGRKFVAVKRRAKMLILDLSPASTSGNKVRRDEESNKILVHLKMSGQFIYANRAELPKRARFFNGPKFTEHELPHKHTHVVFEFADGSRLYYNDLRQFGYLRLVADKEMSRVEELNSYGPEPFAPGFKSEYLAEAAKNRKISVKQFLMDPKVVAGIGNIYTDEILYCAGVRPQNKASKLSKDSWQKICKCTRQVLRSALKRKGSSVGDFFKVDGTEGTFGRIHKVYGRAGKKCRKCGTIIEKLKIGGRTSCFCSKCQS